MELNDCGDPFRLRFEEWLCPPQHPFKDAYDKELNRAPLCQSKALALLLTEVSKER